MSMTDGQSNYFMLFNGPDQGPDTWAWIGRAQTVSDIWLGLTGTMPGVTQ